MAIIPDTASDQQQSGPPTMADVLDLIGDMAAALARIEQTLGVTR